MLNRLNATWREILGVPLSGAPWRQESGMEPFVDRNHRRYPLASLAGCAGVLAGVLTWWFWSWFTTFGIPGAVVSVVLSTTLLPMVIGINSLNGDARSNRMRLVTAIDTMISGHRTIVSTISVKLNGDQQKSAYEAYRVFQRHVYCHVMNRSVWSEDGRFFSFQDAKNAFGKILHSNLVYDALFGGNARGNALIQGADVLANAEARGVEVQALRSCLIFFCTTTCALVLALAGVESVTTASELLPALAVQAEVGATVVGLFVAAITLLLLNANDGLSPWGTGRRSISRVSVIRSMIADIPESATE